MKFKLKYILLLIIIAITIYLVITSDKSYSNPTIDQMNLKFTTYDSSERAVLIINTGSPATLTQKDVGRFIGDMLSDPYVMGMPEWVRTILVHKIIVPFRSGSSYRKYAMIWGDSTFSPLLLNTALLADSIERNIGLPTMMAMRYGSPSVETALQHLAKSCPRLKQVILLPLFPQYARSSYLTAVERVKKMDVFKDGKYDLKTIEPFYSSPSYIELLARQIREFRGGEDDHIVFSFHSLPQSHIRAGKEAGKEYDYEYQCSETVRLTAELLGLKPDTYSIVYASAMGRSWQGPFLDDVMVTLAHQGVKSISVVAPGFIIDNLESLYDIDVNARQIFVDNLGESFTFIPCLNDRFYEFMYEYLISAESTTNDQK